MTLTDDDRLRELYRELNLDHKSLREELLGRLPAQATTEAKFGVLSTLQHIPTAVGG